MTKFGKNIFAKDFNVRAEVTNGKCPLCESPTIFVSLHKSFYRCMNCGGDMEQKVNGVISYIPASMSGQRQPVLTRLSETPKDHD